MKVALIAPPFIAVPPLEYGGTELFVAHLASGLQKAHVEVVVYANGDSMPEAPNRWIYAHSQWPLKSPEQAFIKELNHTSWAMRDATVDCDVIHIQSPQGLAFSRFIDVPIVLTIHGPHEANLSDYYAHFPGAHYVAISDDQRQQEVMPKMSTIHHGVDISQYDFVEHKKKYLSFIGRIAPVKGVHIAIDVAKRTGIPLKIAGEVQPVHKDYFEQKIKPQIDNTLVEYIGPADLSVKNDLLGNSMAMLFPVQWKEPFGLVMVEAMACGTPVLAMPGGSVPEVVRDGISGYVCKSVRQMANRALDLNISPFVVRGYVEENFSIEKMVLQYVEVYGKAIREKNTDRAA